MGRVAQAAVMGPVRGILTRCAVFVYCGNHNPRRKAPRALGQLGDGEKAATVEREDFSALHALAKESPGGRIVITKDPATGAAREGEYTLPTPPAIRMRDLEQQWSKPSLSSAPDDPDSVVALFTNAPREGAFSPVQVRVRFQGKAGGPVTCIAVYRETGPVPPVVQPLDGTAAATPATAFSPPDIAASLALPGRHRPAVTAVLLPRPDQRTNRPNRPERE